MGTVKLASGGSGGSGTTVTVFAVLSLPAWFLAVSVTVKVPASSHTFATLAPWPVVLSPNSHASDVGLFNDRSLKRSSSPTTTSRLDSLNRATGGWTAGSTVISRKTSSSPALLDTARRMRKVPGCVHA